MCDQRRRFQITGLYLILIFSCVFGEEPPTTVGPAFSAPASAVRTSVNDRCASISFEEIDLQPKIDATRTVNWFATYNYVKDGKIISRTSDGFELSYSNECTLDKGKNEMGIPVYQFFKWKNDSDIPLFQDWPEGCKITLWGYCECTQNNFCKVNEEKKNGGYTQLKTAIDEGYYPYPEYYYDLLEMLQDPARLDRENITLTKEKISDQFEELDDIITKRYNEEVAAEEERVKAIRILREQQMAAEAKARAERLKNMKDENYLRLIFPFLFPETE